jgi:hypothetical protein
MDQKWRGRLQQSSQAEQSSPMIIDKILLESGCLLPY